MTDRPVVYDTTLIKVKVVDSDRFEAYIVVVKLRNDHN